MNQVKPIEKKIITREKREPHGREIDILPKLNSLFWDAHVGKGRYGCQGAFGTRPPGEVHQISLHPLKIELEAWVCVIFVPSLINWALGNYPPTQVRTLEYFRMTHRTF
jgi:hypothetical protein